MKLRGAFLDRDGTINARPAEHHYVSSIDAFEWLPGAASGAARLASAGFTLIVVSNQRGVARGLVSEDLLRQIEGEIQARLEANGCRIESFRYCRHDLDVECGCRKPQPGLLLSAAADLRIDLSASWMIGDAHADVQAGRAAGCRTALIGSGAGDCAADVCAQTLDHASQLILDTADGSLAVNC